LKRLSISNLSDVFFWYCYLVLLACLSFVTDSYASANWMLVSAAIYLFAALYFASLLFGGRVSVKAITAARFVIGFWLLIILIHGLQLVLPIQTPIHEIFSVSDAYAPAWYKPDLALSLVPHRTQWFLMREILLLVVLVLSLLLIDSRRRLKQLLWLLLLVGLTHATIAVLAKLGNVHLVDIKAIDGHNSPARGLFVNRNHLSAFVSLCLGGALALQLYWFIQNRQRSSGNLLFGQLLSLQALVISAFTASLFAMVLSQSRAGILAFGVSLFLVLMIYGKRAMERRDRLRLVVPILVVCVLLLLYFGQEIMQKLGSSGLSIGERGAQWQLTWQAIKGSMLFGYGVGSYASVFQILREYEGFRQVTFDQSHNDFLHIWLEQGLLGLSVWLLFLFVTIRSALRSLVKAESSLITAVLLSAIIVIIAALMQSMVDFNLQISNIRCYFFVIIAVVFAAPTVRHRRRS